MTAHPCRAARRAEALAEVPVQPKRLAGVRLITFETAFEQGGLERIESAVRLVARRRPTVMNQVIEGAKEAIWAYWVRRGPGGRMEIDALLHMDGPVPRRAPPKGRRWVRDQSARLRVVAKKTHGLMWELANLPEEALHALFGRFACQGRRPSENPFQNRSAWLDTLNELHVEATAAVERLPELGRKRGAQLDENREKLVSDLGKVWRTAGLKVSRGIEDTSPFLDFVRACCTAAGAGAGTRAARRAVSRSSKPAV